MPPNILKYFKDIAQILGVKKNFFFFKGFYRYFHSRNGLQAYCYGSLLLLSSWLEHIRQHHCYTQSGGVGAGKCSGSVSPQVIPSGETHSLNFFASV